MSKQDIRWRQRFSNYQKALSKLQEVIKQSEEDPLSELETEGLIQRFEYTYELSWKTLQDLLHSKGYLEITGPNPVISQSFKDGIIKDGEAWKKMKVAREMTSHTYNSEIAEEISESIIDLFYTLLKDLETTLLGLISSDQSSLFE